MFRHRCGLAMMSAWKLPTKVSSSLKGLNFRSNLLWAIVVNNWGFLGAKRIEFPNTLLWATLVNNQDFIAGPHYGFYCPRNFWPLDLHGLSRDLCLLVPGPMPSCPRTSREGIALLESLVHTLSFSMSIRNFTTNITLCIGPPDSGTKVFAEKLRPSRKKKGGSCILYACLAIVYCFSYTNWKDTLHFCN